MASNISDKLSLWPLRGRSRPRSSANRPPPPASRHICRRSMRLLVSSFSACHRSSCPFSACAVGWMSGPPLLAGPLGRRRQGRRPTSPCATSWAGPRLSGRFSPSPFCNTRGCTQDEIRNLPSNNAAGDERARPSGHDTGACSPTIDRGARRGEARTHERWCWWYW